MSTHGMSVVVTLLGSCLTISAAADREAWELPVVDVDNHFVMSCCIFKTIVRISCCRLLRCCTFSGVI